MNWRLVLALGCLGIVMGVLSLFGLTQLPVEPILWLIIALVSAYRLAVVPRPFLHGLLSGLAMGILNSITQALFFETYLANNPGSAEAFSQTPGGLSGKAFVLIAAPFVGLGYGILVGLFSLAASRILAKLSP